ncbi:lymphocyte cytosolic protein 2-like [Ranitomeya imitator]|uniref:lymphocyte cytosolic protein 2-like n=1 Tax=Ranitomeya imitator TaxID=111125 RepID=UPI0037E76367
MDFRKVPSCTEVSSWSPDMLIDYFRMCNLNDCEKLVKKQEIDGKRFLEMSVNDIQKFPKTRVPMLIRIQQEINKKEDKKGFFPLRSETQKGYQTGKLLVPFATPSLDASMSESCDGSDSDSFDDDDDDYENPDEQDLEADYESPAAEDEDSNNSDGYEPPPSNNDILPVNPPKTNTSNPDYIDRPVQNSSVRYPPNPPIRTGVSACTSRGNTISVVQSSSQESQKLTKTSKSLAPSVDRTTKPTIQANAGKLPPTSVKNLSGQAKAITLPANIRHIPDAEGVLSPEENGLPV